MVEPNDLVRVALTVESVEELDGDLLVYRIPPPGTGDSTDAAVGALSQVAAYPVRYQGLGVETIGLTFHAPTMRGYYQVAFQYRNESQFRCSDWLIVQDPLSFAHTGS